MQMKIGPYARKANSTRRASHIPLLFDQTHNDALTSPLSSIINTEAAPKASAEAEHPNLTVAPGTSSKLSDSLANGGAHDSISTTRGFRCDEDAKYDATRQPYPAFLRSYSLPCSDPIIWHC
jgi:hypothetical protein